jgi:glycerol-3-phosphate O-acyltransferase
MAAPNDASGPKLMDPGPQSDRSRTPTAQWPAANGDPIVFLLDASSWIERTLLEDWIERNRPRETGAPGFEVVVLPPTRRRKRGATLDRLEARLATGGDSVFAPLRVVWLPEERDGKRAVRFSNLLTLGDPRDPGALRQRWILRRNPDRCRVVAGAPAPLSELRERWRNVGGSDAAQTLSLPEFVARQAALASERSERQLRGARYKVPRLVHEDILGRPAFRGGAARLARELDRSEASVLKEMSANLREIAATHSPFVIDLCAPLIRALYTQGYDEALQYDAEQLESIMALAQRYPVVFLPSHKSNLDHLVLQYMQYENGHPQNHTAGGINMNFFPIGQLVRRSGVFFIRRTFKENPVYKFVLQHYIDYLIEKRFSLEWYIEGGRSRSGKLLPPRFGMLAYVVDAYRRAKSEDVLLIPVSIAYDQIQDVGSYAAEQQGAAKRAESLGWFVGMIRGMRRSYGNIQIRFGEPLSLAKVLGAPNPDASPDPDEQSLAVQKIAFEAAVRINQVTPITSTSLVALALLGRGDRALTVHETVIAVRNLLAYVRRRNLPTTSELELDSDEGVERTLEALVENDVVSRFDGGPEVVYRIGEEHQLSAAYYRNTIIHFFVNSAIAELSMLHAAEPDTPDPVAAFWDEAMQLRDLLKFEFFFAEKEIFRAELRREVDLHASGYEDWERRLAEGADGVARLIRLFRPYTSHRVLRPFLDAYRLVADQLERCSADAEIDSDRFIDDCMGLGKQYLLQGTVRSSASVSQVLIKTALKLAANRGLLKSGTPDIERERREFAEQIRDVVRRIDAIDALAAGRRAGILE